MKGSPERPRRRSRDLVRPEQKESSDAQPEKSETGSIESLLPGIKTDGLSQPSPGLYVATTINTHGMLNDPVAFSQQEVNLGFHEERDAREEELRHFLGGQVVVDLGAGRELFAYNLAHEHGARAYIGVEPNHFAQLDAASDAAKMPFYVVGEDMLSFLQRLPDNSVSLFVFGIDDFILQGAESYKKNVEAEMARVLHPQGAEIMGRDSILSPLGIAQYASFDVRNRTENPRYRIHSKEL